MTEQNGSTQANAGSLDPRLRASDAERGAIAEVLRGHHAEGRIDTNELQDRIEVCYQARTLGELNELLDDLPRHEANGERSAWRLGGPRHWALALAPLALALVAISAFTGRHLVWLAIPLVLLTIRYRGHRYRSWYLQSRGGEAGRRRL